MTPIERCDQEMARIASTPSGTTERAYLLVMGQFDWAAEKRLIEMEVGPDTPSVTESESGSACGSDLTEEEDLSKENPISLEEFEEWVSNRFDPENLYRRKRMKSEKVTDPRAPLSGDEALRPAGQTVAMRAGQRRESEHGGSHGR